MIKVCLIGLGKTGKEIAKVMSDNSAIKIVGAVCSPASDKIGKDLGEVIGYSPLGITVSSSEKLKQLVFKTRPDVVVDFSNPEAVIKNARILSPLKVNMVVGTTGFSKFSLNRLFIMTKKYHNGIVYAPNITLGVNVLMLLTNIASSLLNSYDFQITEVHHKHKKDSPSGTAVKIADEINKGLKSSGVEVFENVIPINSVRAGGVIGKHEVLIVGDDDKIEISHESFSRRAFALGAIKAVEFIRGKTGYYEMSDVLNLSKVLGDYIEKENSRHQRRMRMI